MAIFETAYKGSIDPKHVTTPKARHIPLGMHRHMGLIIYWFGRKKSLLVLERAFDR